MAKVTLKRHRVNELANAIKALDGRPELVKDDDGKSLGIINKPYDLDEKARIAAAKTLRWISGDLADWETVQKAIQNKPGRVDADGNPLKGEDKNKQVDDELRAFMMESVEVKVHATAISGFKVSTNKLSPLLISSLSPMIVGELDEDAIE